ncbi:DNA polymerase-3 subunit beta [Rhizobium sp. SG_E_25_P2]|uniref:DNA polymerase III subunit beta n=1 Tax=Rhizobium sp. SG_E_25_P2 TaxID=2879942 RepID=UPI00247559B0|nr:DNA polymerase III subunit beta [Rhizobium sp. SG_E_25_P2]MDH6265506.1 DNA polymerase-3 subunit beta [Rhizobium sp. SG_E_25_P2]
MMFTVEKSRFAAILAEVDKVVKPKNTIPILQHVVFERREDTLIVRGSDLDVEMIGELPAEFGPGFFAFTCESRSILEFVRSAPTTEITAAAVGSERQFVSFTSGRARLRLPILPGGDFPRLEPAENAFGFRMSGAALSAALSAVAYAASNDISRPQICGVLLEGGEDGLSVVATDGKRLEKRLLPPELFAEDIEIDQIPRVTLPTESALRIAKLAADADRCELSVASNLMAARVGAVSFVTKLIEDIFPTVWRRVIPEGLDIVATLGRDHFEAALSRVMIANAKAGEGGVWLVLTPGAMALHARSQDGDAVDQMECDVDTSISFAIIGSQAIEALNRIKAERIEIALAAPDAAFVLRPARDRENLVTIMPYRLSWRPEE